MKEQCSIYVLKKCITTASLQNRKTYIHDSQPNVIYKICHRDIHKVIEYIDPCDMENPFDMASYFSHVAVGMECRDYLGLFAPAIKYK